MEEYLQWVYVNCVLLGKEALVACKWGRMNNPKIQTHRKGIFG